MQSHTHRSRTLLVISAFVISAFVAILTVVLVSITFTSTNADADKREKVATIESLEGNWHQINAEDTGVYMTAEVTKSSIQIHMKARESTGIYWIGTFNSDQDLSKKIEIVSNADQDALSQSIFGSQDKTKTFTYENGKLSYQFSIMGMESTVKLSK